MKKSLKVIALGLVLTMGLSLVGCGSDNKDKAPQETTPPAVSENVEPLNVMALTGPTGMGMVSLLDKEAAKEKPDYQITLAGAADEISGGLINGDVDIAAIPCNLASVLYQKTKGQIQVAAVNTLGVLYILENGDTINSVADLAGKTIISTGKGTTPEYTLNYILSQNGLDPANDVVVEYKTEAAEIAAAFQNGEANIAMVPQPVATTILQKNEGVRIALDVTEEWAKVQGEEVHQLITGVVVVQKDVAENNKAAVDQFLSDYQESIAFINNNVDEGAALVEKYGIVPQAAIAKIAIPKCNIVYMDNEEMKANVEAYLQVLFDANPQAVGGSMPDDGFYYQK